MKAFPQILKAYIFCRLHSVDSHLVHRSYTTRTASRIRPSFIGTRRDPSPKGGNTSSRALRRSSRHDIVFALLYTFKVILTITVPSRTRQRRRRRVKVFIIILPLRNRVPTTFPELHSEMYSSGVVQPEHDTLSTDTRHRYVQTMHILSNLRLYIDTGIMPPQSSVTIQHSKRGNLTKCEKSESRYRQE